MPVIDTDKIRAYLQSKMEVDKYDYISKRQDALPPIIDAKR